ncbi:hypothetical protein ACHAXH_004545, partial [Discostella pseudostelligera]
PLRSLRNVVECFRFYDASTWNANLELLDRGIKVGVDMLLPALLLSLVGSLLPTSQTVDKMIPVSGLPPLIGAFSPYTYHSLALSSPPSDAQQLSFMLDFDPSYFMRCMILSVISPTAIDLLLHYFAPILIQTLSRLRAVLLSRKSPDDSTKEALGERVRMGRAVRRQAFDLYFPPNDAGDTRRDFIPSLLFFPGFGVHHSSYADVASRISDYGIPVAVASLEPLRLAHKKLGGGMDDVRRLIWLAGEELVMHYKRLHLDEKVVIEWALGGHSMGGYNALQLAEVLQASNGQVNSVSLKDGSISRLGAKIVAWAAGTNAQSFPDLRDATLLRVLILTASNDSIASISSPQQKQQLLSKLPKRTRLIKINGGNHSGFASYDDASNKSGTMSVNGPRHISLELQQKEASRLTASFLLQK